jgi:hypothetical protein
MFWYTTLMIFLLSCNNAEKAEDALLEQSRTFYHSEAYTFCQSNEMNTDFYYLVDFRVHSGKDRFFVFDFNSETYMQKGLVTHGACDVFEPNPTKYEKAKFSNRNNSHCSSKGKYKIGSRDFSSWGIHVKYWLHGLEPANSNAKDRVVVLHSWSAVEDNETFPVFSPLSWGCPAVSDNFMTQLDKQLKATKKPTLLWIVG